MPTESERITKLEVTQDFHSIRIGILESQALNFSKSLQAIQGNINQIKWLGYGAAAGYLLREVGILHFIKGLL